MLSIAQKELIGVQKDSPAGLFEFAILILDKFCLYYLFLHLIHRILHPPFNIKTQNE